MFGLEFLFSAALFALPLAGLPLILHLLYRRKSPVVQFPTLRFIKASLQQSAARRKVQRWLLLAIRMLLMALLIWAVAQPAKALATRFFSSAEQSVAVIVVDTSWSMQYRQNQVPLVSEADQIIQQLLRGELKDASVLMVTTNGGENGKFRPASEMLSDWVPLATATGHEPLAERVMASVDLLNKHPASQKLLVVISDFQSREFPRPMPQLAESQVRTVVIDLHPTQARSAGVQAISLSPQQPIAGLRVTAEVDVSGPAGDVRPVQLAVTELDGKPLLARPPAMVTFDSFGQATARFEFQMPQQRWQLVTASLQGDDPMPWDDTRSIVVELPPQQSVAVQDGPEATAGARKLVRLALDPTEGKLANWPLKVQPGRADQQTNAIVAVVDGVPDMATISAWRAFVSNGGTLVLMLKPGMEAAWPTTPEAQAFEQLLPSKPYGNTSDQMVHFLPGSAARTDAATMGLADDAKALEDLRATRIVPMNIADSRSTRILIAGSTGGRRPAVDREGLLYVKRVGSGRVFTWSCIPDALLSNLGTHPLFLPLLVNQCLRPLDTSLATNTTIGDAITWDKSPTLAEMEVHTPANAAFRVPRNGTKFTYDQTTAPGLYEWFVPGQGEMKGIANATVHGEESQSVYRPADTLFPQSPNILVAHSLPEMQNRIAEVTQPQPKWTMPLAIAMMLLSTESLLSTETGLWSWLKRK